MYAKHSAAVNGKVLIAVGTGWRRLELSAPEKHSAEWGEQIPAQDERVCNQ